MSDGCNDVRVEINRFLRQNPARRPFQTTEVVEFLLRGGHSSSCSHSRSLDARRKAQINSILYELLGRGELVRISHSPPVWLSNPNHTDRESVPIESSSYSSSSTAAMTKGVDRQTTGQAGGGRGRPDLVANILKIMDELKLEESIHPRILAKQLMLCRKSDVNPVLYQLQKEGKIAKVANCPPLWKRCHSSSSRSEHTTASTLQGATTDRELHDSTVARRAVKVSTFDPSFLRTSSLDDRLATVVTDVYGKLRKSLQCSNYDDCGFGSIASFVVQNAGELRVVALGTGCDAISKDRQFGSEAVLSEAQRAIVVARRSFKRFLCHELMNYHLKNGDLSNTLERSCENPARFKLKEGISLHLYLYNYEITVDRKENVESKCENKCNRRFKTESQVEADCKALTDDESLRRPHELRLRTEKIVKWAVVGVQGSLLSNYLSPMYLDSVTIGFPSDEECNTFSYNWKLLAKLGPSLTPLLPPSFKPTIPKLGKVSRELSSLMGMCCNESTNWSLGDSSLEVIDRTSARLYSEDEGISSRLADRNVFKDFLFLCRLSGRHDLFNMKTLSQCQSVAREYLLASALFKTQLIGRVVASPSPGPN